MGARRPGEPDEFGAACEISEEFLVVEEGGVPAALPALLKVERSAVQVGETARLLVQSLKLAKANITKRFDKRMANTARDMEDRYSRMA